MNKFLIGQDSSCTELPRKMSTCSSGSEVLGEGYEEGVEQYVESMREHQDINLEDFKNSKALDVSGDEAQGINF